MQERRLAAAREVRRLAFARGISVAGSGAAFTALTVTVYETTGSATWIATTLLLTFGVRGLASFFAGSVGDRFDRRRVMVACDLAGAALFGLMAAVQAPEALIGLAFLAAMVEVPFESASAAAIPILAGEERLSWANSMVSVGRNLGYTLGPVVGGAAAASIGAGWVFGANAVTFVASAALIAGIRSRMSGARDAEATSWIGVREGIARLVRDPVLRLLSLADAVLVLGMGLVLVADLPLATELGMGGFGYGVLYGAWGVGLVAGSFLGRRMTARTEPFWVLAGAMILAVQGVSVAVTPWFWVIVAITAVAGAGDSLWLISTLGTRQRRTPDAVRSRVLAASDGVIYLAFVPSFVFAGSVTAAIGPRGSYLVYGIAAATAAVALIPVWRWARVPRVGPAP
jgi:MFS family permease